MFETIQYAPCHRKFSWNFVHCKMHISRISQSIEVYPFYAFLDFETIHHAYCHHNSSHMLNEMFVKLSILRDPNMKMCTLVVYPGPLSFSRVMPVWTWKFDTIHCALCHHNSSHMLNEMFVKLSMMQDPNMKMCTLVPYPGPLSFSRVMPKTMHLYILRF
jgi:hypothetical protein